VTQTQYSFILLTRELPDKVEQPLVYPTKAHADATNIDWAPHQCPRVHRISHPRICLILGLILIALSRLIDRSVQRQMLGLDTRTLEKIVHGLAAALELLLSDDLVRVCVMDLEPDVGPVVEEAGVDVILEHDRAEVIIARPVLFGDSVAFRESVRDGDASRHCALLSMPMG
ncbi:hypothetical protein GQ44DRAFT_229348, partial [Phaeosphaeriaceae sp. PMI808]